MIFVTVTSGYCDVRVDCRKQGVQAVDLISRHAFAVQGQKLPYDRDEIASYSISIVEVGHVSNHK